MSELERTSVLLGFQRALLGNVPPSLRGLTAEWDAVSIRGIAYFDGPVSQVDQDCIGDIEAEVLADLAPGRTIRLEVQRLDAPGRMPCLKVWVYRRREHFREAP